MHDILWPRGPTDKASDFESEDCGFDPHRGHTFSLFLFDYVIITSSARFSTRFYIFHVVMVEL